MKKIIFALFIFLFFFSGVFFPALAEEGGQVEMYFFWGDGCPHCAAAKPFLAELEKDYPELKIKSYETWNPGNENNYELFMAMARAYNIPNNQLGVPAFFMGDKYITGYQESMDDSLKSWVEDCIGSVCVSPSAKLSLGGDDNKIAAASETDNSAGNLPRQRNSYASVFIIIILAAIGLIYYLFSVKAGK